MKGAQSWVPDRGDYVKMKCAEKGIKPDMERAREEKPGSGKSSKRSGVGAPKFNAFVSFHLPRRILPFSLAPCSMITEISSSA